MVRTDFDTGSDEEDDDAAMLLKYSLPLAVARAEVHVTLYYRVAADQHGGGALLLPGSARSEFSFKVTEHVLNLELCPLSGAALLDGIPDKSIPRWWSCIRSSVTARLHGFGSQPKRHATGHANHGHDLASAGISLAWACKLRPSGLLYVRVREVRMYPHALAVCNPARESRTTKLSDPVKIKPMAGSADAVGLEPDAPAMSTTYIADDNAGCGWSFTQQKVTVRGGATNLRKQKDWSGSGKHMLVDERDRQRLRWLRTSQPFDPSTHADDFRGVLFLCAEPAQSPCRVFLENVAEEVDDEGFYTWITPCSIFNNDVPDCAPDAPPKRHLTIRGNKLRADQIEARSKDLVAKWTDVSNRGRVRVVVACITNNFINNPVARSLLYAIEESNLVIFPLILVPAVLERKDRNYMGVLHCINAINWIVYGGVTFSDLPATNKMLGSLVHGLCKLWDDGFRFGPGRLASEGEEEHEDAGNVAISSTSFVDNLPIFSASASFVDDDKAITVSPVDVIHLQ